MVCVHAAEGDPGTDERSRGLDESSEATHQEELHLRVAQAQVDWQRSHERKALVREWVAFALIFALGFYLAMSQAAPWFAERNSSSGSRLGSEDYFVGYFMSSVLVVALGFTLFIVGQSRRRFYKDLFAARVLVERKRSRLQNNEMGASGDGGAAPTLDNLWSLTQQRLDYYHDLAMTQAETSFARAQTAMISGFVLVLLLGWLAVTSTSEAGSVVAGSLAGITGLVTTYISATFIRSQESASSHLRSYFTQPLEFSRFLAAERIALRLEGDARAQALSAVAIAIVTGPQSGDTGAESRSPA